MRDSLVVGVVLVDGGHAGAGGGAAVLRVLAEGHGALHAVSEKKEKRRGRFAFRMKFRNRVRLFSR